MKQTNDINAKIFMALKVAEVTKIPFLLISAPGVGKSETCNMFAKIRGYHLELLRGNSSQLEDINGCNVFSGNGEDNSLKQMRPAWFQRVLNMEEKGVPTLLFLDEITTANAYIQSSLLNLVFDRAVGEEHLPDDCLVVSAGNYSQSLGNQFGLIPPLMNRFCIYNISPTMNDIESFLSRYNGASSGSEEYKLDLFETKKDLLNEIDKQEKALDETYMAAVAEYVEKAILETTRMLIKQEKLLDLNVKDMQNIFTDTIKDQNLYGFISPRSLFYLLKVSLGMYRCFGLDGIKSDNFKNMINGLAGIALNFNGNNGEVKNNLVGDRYFQYIGKAVNDVESKHNNKVIEYTNYFNSILTSKDKNGKIKSKKSLSYEEINSVSNKFEELIADQAVKDIERPIDKDRIIEISSILKKSSLDIAGQVTGSGSSVDSNINISTEDLSKLIVNWNLIKSTERKVNSFISESSRGYDKALMKVVETDLDDINRHCFKLQYLIKQHCKNNPTVEGLIPKLDTKA